jgi:hypothetical protein
MKTLWTAGVLAGMPVSIMLDLGTSWRRAGEDAGGPSA